MALELSNKTWNVVFGDGARRRHVTEDTGDLGQLREEIEKSRVRFAVVGDGRMVSCHEAGRDGFWLHRCLRSIGAENEVVDSSSIEVNRRRRRAKTDRIDGDKLLELLVRHHGGERGGWSVVHVPSEREQDARRLHREPERLKREQLSHRNRIGALQ